MGGVDMTSVTPPPRAWRTDMVRMLLTVLAVLPYALGRAAGAVAVACVWVWAAVLVGWRDATGDGPGR